MKNMRLKPAMRYQLEYMLDAFLSIMGVTVLIMIAMFILGVTFGAEAETEMNILVIGSVNIGGMGNFSFNMASIMVMALFIIGIAGIREDIKMFLQHGMGRYTVYFSTLFAALVCGALMGLFFQLLNLLYYHWPVFPARGLGFQGSGFFSGWLWHMGVLFFAWQLGTLISLIYYRLSGRQAVIFSVAAGGLMLFVLPGFIGRLVSFVTSNVAGQAVFTPAPGGFGSRLTAIFFFGMLSAGLNFLLIRRAQVRE